MVSLGVVTALLVILLALLIAFGPIAVLIVIPLYVMYRRAHPERPLRTHVKVYRGRIWRIW